MLSTVAYHCGLCGKPGDAQYDEDMVHRLERWIPLLHCNRCADFRTMLRKLRDNCKRLTLLRWQLQQAARLTRERDDLIRTEIVNLTKAIARLTCVHWRIEIIWEQDFAEQLLDFPDKAEFIVNQYAAMIKEQAAQAHAQLLLPAP